MQKQVKTPELSLMQSLANFGMHSSTLNLSVPLSMLKITSTMLKSLCKQTPTQQLMLLLPRLLDQYLIDNPFIQFLLKKVIFNNVVSWKFLDNLKRVSPISVSKKALEILACNQCGLRHIDLLNYVGGVNKRIEWNLDVRFAADIPFEYNEYIDHNMQACEQPLTKQILNTIVHYIWVRHLILILDDFIPLAERLLRLHAPAMVYRINFHNTEPT